MQRVKNVAYDEDDVYSDDDDYYEGGGEGGAGTEEYTAEDRENFATLTPVVRAELDEAGIQDVTNLQIEEALWHYYWDVGKSVTYLKNTRTPRPAQESQAKTAKKDVAKGNRFDEAAKKSAVSAPRPPLSAAEWFKDTPWTQVPEDMLGVLVPVEPLRPPPKLLGGSSKLAKLAEERRKKAAEARATAPASASDARLASLDRLVRPKTQNESAQSAMAPEPRKYPIRKKKEPTPPPREPTPPPPPPEEPEEQLPDLRSSPTAFGRTLSTGLKNMNGAKIMTLEELFGTSQTPDAFQELSPDDAVMRAQQQSKGLNKGNAKATAAANGLAKKTEALKLESTSQTPPQPKVRSKGLDVPKLWEESKAKRSPSAAFVVIGHVDHGKSTLMGRLLLDTGAVAQRDIDKYKKQAAELGKSSFALAWVMDVGSDEREHGITIDFAHHHFHANGVDFTILDAPGHRDFVPNMIAGASMADFAVLVVDVNQIESGMKGQTREHILLAYATGIRRIVVAVNKLDSTNPPWNADLYHTVVAQVTKVLTQTGFSEENIAFVPCSGLSGANVVHPPSNAPNAKWISENHSTLLKQLEQSLPAPLNPALIQSPFRMPIGYADRGDSTNALTVTGRVRAGTLQVGDTILVQPIGETATIKSISVNRGGDDDDDHDPQSSAGGGGTTDWTVPGDICTLRLTDIDKDHVRGGDVLCDPRRPVVAVASFTARVRALDVGLLPEPVSFHLGRLDKPAWIRQLVATLEEEGGEAGVDVVRKKKPRVVPPGSTALVRLALEEALPLEKGDRIVLRSRGNTMATGTVVETEMKG